MVIVSAIVIVILRVRVIVIAILIAKGSQNLSKRVQIHHSEHL